MCFSMLQKVKYVEDPTSTHEFKVFKGVGDDGDWLTDARTIAWTAAQICMKNRAVAEAVKQAERHGRIEEIQVPRQINTQMENSVLFINPIVRAFLNGGPYYKEVTWVDPHYELRDRAILLKLSDFSYVAQYSFDDHSDGAPLTEDLLGRYELRLKLGLGSTEGIIYQLPKDWQKELLAVSR